MSSMRRSPRPRISTSSLCGVARHVSARKRRNARPKGECRNGHSFSRGQEIGGGILRFVCSTCGGVSIDVTGADLPSTRGSLFESLDGVLGRS